MLNCFMLNVTRREKKEEGNEIGEKRTSNTLRIDALFECIQSPFGLTLQV